MLDILKLEATMEGDFQNVSVQIYFNNGRQEKKAMSFKDYTRCIMQSEDAANKYLHIGKFPDGFYDGAVNMQDGSSFRAAFLLPSGVRILNFFGEIFAVPYPDLIFLFEAKHGKLNRSYVFALAPGYEEQGDAVVCQYPFGNVYADGRICWGTVDLPDVSDIRKGPMFIGLFIGSETNMDLYRPPCHRPEFQNQRGLLEHIAGKDAYPLDCLNPTPKRLTELVEGFINFV